MKYVYTTRELLTVLHSAGMEPTPASPFRRLMTVNCDLPPLPLPPEQRLLATFALTPTRTVSVGRRSAADGDLYLLNIGAIWYLYSRLEKQDLHVFEAYFDRPRLLKFLAKNFTPFYSPNFGAYTQLNLRLTEDEYLVWNLIRALYASRARNGTGNNHAFRADDLKIPDLTAYLCNYADELSLSALSSRLRLLTDEKTHEAMEEALNGLERKGILTPDLAPVVEHEDEAYCLTRTAMERLDDGMLVDTLRFSDRTNPEHVGEILLCLRRDGVLALIPTKEGVALRSFPDVPWEELI